MCGIAGMFATGTAPVVRQEIESMCAALVRRGPDDEGYFVDGRIGLGMRRLSVIDIATGQQPVGNEDGSIQVVMNGEIYNYRELRKLLQGRGHVFASESDTEVLVHLYEEYGEEFVHRLRGMFAFALWDANRQQLLVVRDRLGIKPLYFGEIDGRLVFASELKALLQLPWVPRELDWGAVAHLFTFLSTSRTQSIVRGIRKLEPGHLLTIGPHQPLAIRKYWDVRFTADTSHSEDWFVARLRELLDESVRMHMVCDVSFGAFLSGGIDSGAVVATMAQHSRQPVKTFTIGFADAAYNELEAARLVAGKYGTDHHELVVEPDVMNMLGELVWDLDEPFGDSSALPTYMVSKLAASHVKVVLSGDGGDELFAGYDKYRVEERERRYRYIPAALRGLMGNVGARMQEGSKGRNFLRHIALDGNARYLDANSLFDREQLQALFLAPFAAEVLAQDPWHEMTTCLQRERSHWLSALQYLDLKNYLPLDILTKVDRMSMAHSLEARVPLLDHKLVEFAATIPPHLRLKDGSTKHIFKQALRGILPDAIIDRRKQGFAVPLGRWFRGELSGFVHDLLLSDTCRTRQIFNPAYIEKLLQLQQRGRPVEQQLWTLISFELWCRTFLDQPLASHKPRLARSAQGSGGYTPEGARQLPANGVPA